MKLHSPVGKTHDELAATFGQDRVFRSLDDLVNHSTHQQQEGDIYLPEAEFDRTLLLLLGHPDPLTIGFQAYDRSKDVQPLVIEGYIATPGDGK